MASACVNERPANAQQPTSAITPAVAQSHSLDTSRRTAIVDATSRVAPAVVSVRAITRQQAPTSSFDAFFFGQREQTAQSFGTGFIIRSDGIILRSEERRVGTG